MRTTVADENAVGVRVEHLGAMGGSAVPDPPGGGGKGTHIHRLGGSRLPLPNYAHAIADAGAGWAVSHLHERVHRRNFLRHHDLGLREDAAEATLHEIDGEMVKMEKVSRSIPRRRLSCHY